MAEASFACVGRSLPDNVTQHEDPTTHEVLHVMLFLSWLSVSHLHSAVFICLSTTGHSDYLCFCSAWYVAPSAGENYARYL